MMGLGGFMYGLLVDELIGEVGFVAVHLYY